MHSGAAVKVKEVMGKDGRMKEVRRRVQVDAHGNPLARKVHVQECLREVLTSPLLPYVILSELLLQNSMSLGLFC